MLLHSNSLVKTFFRSFAHFLAPAHPGTRKRLLRLPPPQPGEHQGVQTPRLRIIFGIDKRGIVMHNDYVSVIKYTKEVEIWLDY